MTEHEGKHDANRTSDGQAHHGFCTTQADADESKGRGQTCQKACRTRIGDGVAERFLLVCTFSPFALDRQIEVHAIGKGNDDHHGRHDGGQKVDRDLEEGQKSEIPDHSDDRR